MSDFVSHLQPGAAFPLALILGILASKACAMMLELVLSATSRELFGQVTSQLL